jgi:peptide chain release factor subunit 1
MVPGKTNKGGQSAARYGRIRENMAKEFYRKIADIMKQEFFHLGSNLKGILVGGPGPTKEDFLKEGQLLTVLEEKVIGVKDIGYADEHGIELLVEASQDILANQEIIYEKKLLEKFFNMLGKQPERTAYTVDPVKKAMDYGAVDTLFLSKKLDKKIIREFEKRAEETNVKVELISVETEEGQQFYNLSGIGAILRFKL